MYKTKCKQCGRIFDTEEEYYSFVCGQCTERLNKQRQLSYEDDKVTLDTMRREVDNAIANGEPEELIKIKTMIYNNWVEHMKTHYGSEN